MRVIGYNVFRIGSDCTINKFIIVGISLNQSKMDVHFLKNSCV